MTDCEPCATDDELRRVTVTRRARLPETDEELADWEPAPMRREADLLDLPSDVTGRMVGTVEALRQSLERR